MKRRRAAIAVVAVLSLLGTVAVADVGPATATVDPYQELVVTTEPAGAVTVGQSFSLDASWANRSGFAIPGFLLSVEVPSGFRVDEVLVVEATQAASCSTLGDPSNGTIVVCDFDLYEATQNANLVIRLSITPLEEADDAHLVATATNSAWVWIEDTAVIDVVDQPTVTIGPPITIAEGDDGLHPLTLDAPSPQAVSVTCIAGGWTAGPSDFTFGASQTLTFEPGQTSAYLQIDATQDALDEPDAELVLVACGGVVNAHAANPGLWGLMWGLVGIVDDDPPPVILPGSISQPEGAATTVNVPVTLSAPSGRTVTARWQTEDHVARAPDDYTSASGTVTFQPGETAKTIAVTVRDDTIEEPDELFVVVFFRPQNATIGGFYGLAFVNLLDDD